MLKLCWVATWLGVTALHAAATTFESPESQVPLVELYTSEGCSSCPPAEAWMSAWRTNPDLWKRCVPVAFHVDYWDGLGWPDRFATAANTTRQRRYAAAWGGDSIYTPGFVLNGREWRGWRGDSTLPEPASTRVGKLTVSVGDGQADIVFNPAASVPNGLRIELALLGGDLEINVTRGENGGRKLRHDFTVLHVVSAPLRATSERYAAHVSWPAKMAVAPSAIAAWVISGEVQPPIQATGGWLQKDLATIPARPSR